MNRLARSPMLALPGILFVALTQVAPALRPAEAAGDQTLQLDPARAALMKSHFHEALAIENAIVRGELAAVGPAAAALAAAPPPAGLPAATTPHLKAMKAAAGRAAAATTLPTASLEAATMLSACGECHLSAGVRPAPPFPSRSDAEGRVGHMQAHQRAIELMLHGLLVPSTSLWREGAEALSVAPLHRSELSRASNVTDEVLSAEKRVHRMAEEAIATAAPPIRVRQYAQLLTTCAECHSANKKLQAPSGVRPPRP